MKAFLEDIGIANCLSEIQDRVRDHARLDDFRSVSPYFCDGFGLEFKLKHDDDERHARMRLYNDDQVLNVHW